MRHPVGLHSIRHLSLMLLLAGLGSHAAADGLQAGKSMASGAPDNRVVIYLGSIAVDGERKVYQALQDIKVALEQPLTTDPKLADAMVCRLADEIGSHAKQVLICGTNRVLAMNRVIVQTGADGVAGVGHACAGGGCSDQAYGILYESINNQPRLFILQQVNGGYLKALLASIPYPATPSTATPMRGPLPVLPPPHTPRLGPPEKAESLADDPAFDPALALAFTMPASNGVE